MILPAFFILSLAGGALAWLLVRLLAPKKGRVEVKDAWGAAMVGIGGGVVGAIVLRPMMRVFNVLVHWGSYNFASIGEVMRYLIGQGEIVFFGSLIGGALAIFLFCRKRKMKVTPLFDLFAPAFALAHGVGRIGCFLGGCCYGVQVEPGHPLAVIYPSVSMVAPPGVPLIAVPLIEAIALAILFIVLTIVYLKSERDGLSVAVYFLAYSVVRFSLEFFRGDIVRGVYGALTTSQYISIGVFLAGILYLIYLTRKPKPEAGQ